MMKSIKIFTTFFFRKNKIVTAGRGKEPGHQTGTLATDKRDHPLIKEPR